MPYHLAIAQYFSMLSRNNRYYIASFFKKQVLFSFFLIFLCEKIFPSCYLTLSVQRAKRLCHVILSIFGVILSRRTSSTPLSSALKMGKIPMAGVGESEGLRIYNIPFSEFFFLICLLSYFSLLVCIKYIP